MENTENKQSELTQEEIEEIYEILSTENLDPTTCINIIIKMVLSAYEENFFNDLYKNLIAKAILSLKKYVDNKEDIIIKNS